MAFLRKKKKHFIFLEFVYQKYFALILSLKKTLEELKFKDVREYKQKASKAWPVLFKTTKARKDKGTLRHHHSQFTEVANKHREVSSMSSRKRRVCGEKSMGNLNKVVINQL